MDEAAFRQILSEIEPNAAGDTGSAGAAATTAAPAPAAGARTPPTAPKNGG
jgi:hypothetical protein